MSLSHKALSGTCHLICAVRTLRYVRGWRVRSHRELMVCAILQTTKEKTFEVCHCDRVAVYSKRGSSAVPSVGKRSWHHCYWQLSTMYRSVWCWQWIPDSLRSSCAEWHMHLISRCAVPDSVEEKMWFKHAVTDKQTSNDLLASPRSNACRVLLWQSRVINFINVKYSKLMLPVFHIAWRAFFDGFANIPPASVEFELWVHSTAVWMWIFCLLC